MANTPNVGAPLWAASEVSPWIMSAKRALIFDAFCSFSIVEDRDLSSPPGACADGARYLIAAGASGLWTTHSGQLAIALGANASNGWYYATVALEGVELWVRDENIKLRHNGAAWVEITDSLARIQDMHDVTIAGLVDGYVLKWDASNGLWYPAPDVSGGGVGTVTEPIIIAASDEVTALAAGTGKVTFRMPYAFTLTEVRASLVVAQTGGTTLKADLNEAGTSVLGANKLTFDNGQKSTGTAAQSGITITTVSSIADASLADNAEMSVDIDAIGDGTAKGLKVTLIGHQ